ncbi:ATP-dependent RNA helicase rhlE [Salmonella enterica subsp. enterica]|uniref:ATP-dependent RNA helicase rhlE n=1 Tax=Salmonella enterica I TaxID=59201 RepID=A0A447MVF1_SALET|nr:ATP-dependent RNA helicase rhlE [Salmonella enterica subsp. enterica]
MNLPLFSNRRFPPCWKAAIWMASAQTGTGKTAGFTLPLLQHLITHQPHAKGRRPVRALILTPTPRAGGANWRKRQRLQ